MGRNRPIQKNDKSERKCKHTVQRQIILATWRPSSSPFLFFFFFLKTRWPLKYWRKKPLPGLFSAFDNNAQIEFILFMDSCNFQDLRRAIYYPNFDEISWGMFTAFLCKTAWESAKQKSKFEESRRYVWKWERLSPWSHSTLLLYLSNLSASAEKYYFHFMF